MGSRFFRVSVIYGHELWWPERGNLNYNVCESGSESDS